MSISLIQSAYDTGDVVTVEFDTNAGVVRWVKGSVELARYLFDEPIEAHGWCFAATSSGGNSAVTITDAQAPGESASSDVEALASASQAATRPAAATPTRNDSQESMTASANVDIVVDHNQTLSSKLSGWMRNLMG